MDSNIGLEVAAAQLDKDYHSVQVYSPKANISQLKSLTLFSYKIEMPVLSINEQNEQCAEFG
jgi:hypothetical protein